MRLSRKEYEREIASLKSWGLTDIEIEGYFNFYKKEFKMNLIYNGRVVNTGGKNAHKKIRSK